MFPGGVLPSSAFFSIVWAKYSINLKMWMCSRMCLLWVCRFVVARILVSNNLVFIYLSPRLPHKDNDCGWIRIGNKCVKECKNAEYQSGVNRTNWSPKLYISPIVYMCIIVKMSSKEDDQRLGRTIPLKLGF